MERDHAIALLQRLIGHDLRKLADELGITVFKPNGKLNKGWAGQTLERYLGIPLNTSREPNLGSWELKLVSVKKNTRGNLTIKETMAITMLDPEEVKAQKFEDSHLFRKLRKIISVVREWESSEEIRSTVLKCNEFELDGTKLCDEVKQDYEDVQTALIRGIELSGKMGTYVQPRTKGPGHGSRTRAFYARKNLVEYIAGYKESPLKTTLHSDDCPKHAGIINATRREFLDTLCHELPRNQSGAGRHKCVYCAYEEGYKAGLEEAESAVMQALQLKVARSVQHTG